MSDIFSRSTILFGDDNLKKLKDSKVALFGIGGVGGYVAEALARSGVGSFLLERILDINPDADVTVSKCFFLPENSGEIDFSGYSYIVDAVDTVSAKIEIIMKAEKCNVPVISSMGTGNKLEPSMLRIADIYDTSECPLARVMRHELKARGIKKLKCVYSTEKPIKPDDSYMNMHDEGVFKRQIPGSVVFVPAVAGLLMAGEIVRDLCRE